MQQGPSHGATKKTDTSKSLWPKAYATPNQEASTVAEALVTNFVCCFGVPWKLQSDQGHNFKSQIIQEVLKHSGVSETRTTPLH